MTRGKTLSVSAFALLLGIAFTLDALAQFPGGGTGGGRRGSRSGDTSRGTVQTPQPSMGEGADLLEYRLGMLEEDLKLTPTQMKGWDAYADRMRDMAADALRERSKGASASSSITPPNALQQVNRAMDSARDRLTALEDIAAATKQFYEMLGAEQKMLVDSRMPSLLPLVTGSARPATATGDRAGAPPDAGGGGRGRDGGTRAN